MFGQLGENMLELYYRMQLETLYPEHKILPKLQMKGMNIA